MIDDEVNPETLDPRYVLYKAERNAITATYTSSNDRLNITDWYTSPLVSDRRNAWTSDPESGISLDLGEAARLLPVLVEFLAKAGGSALDHQAIARDPEAARLIVAACAIFTQKDVK